MNVNILRVLAIIMFCGAVFFGWYGYQMSQPKTPVVAAVVEPVKQPQLVAAQRILPRQVIQPADIETVMVTQSDPAGFTSASTVVGKVVLHEINAGEPLLQHHFAQYGPAARQLLPGERAVAVKIDEVSGVGGYIKPGDHVDVLFFANDEKNLSRSSLSQIVLSDLRVLSFGDAIEDTKKPEPVAVNALSTAQKEAGSLANSSPKPDTGIRSAVLAVPEKDATTLMLAANMGQLRLSLRGERVAPEVITSSGSDGKAHTATAKAPGNQPENYFVRSEELLKPDGLNREPRTSSQSPPVARAASKPKVKSSQVIMHYGDATETVVTRDLK
jgi:pilus assembly protein CpaB